MPSASASVDLDAVKKQVEFYFSDANLPRDRFLRGKTEEDPNGFVDISVISSFKRMQALGGTNADIVAALRQSDSVILSDDGARIRRATPIPADINETSRNRTIYAKGWVPGGPEPSLEDVVALFSPSGKVLGVRVRRWSDDEGKHFKGSIFIEMETPEACERVVAEEYSIQVEVDGEKKEKELILLSFVEYIEKKKKESSMRDKKKSRVRDYNKGDGKDKPASDAKRDGANTENGAAPGAKSVDAAEQQDASAPKTENGASTNGEEKPKPKPEVIRGLVLKFVGFGPDVSREDIREALEPHGIVEWVDFRRGDTDGCVRFSKEGEAEEAKKGLTEAGTEFGGQKPTFSVLEGEKEDEYWDDVWKKKAEAAQSRKRRWDGGGNFRGGDRKRFRGRGGRGRGGRGRGGFRGRR